MPPAVRKLASGFRYGSSPDRLSSRPISLPTPAGKKWTSSRRRHVWSVNPQRMSRISPEDARRLWVSDMRKRKYLKRVADFDWRRYALALALLAFVPVAAQGKDRSAIDPPLPQPRPPAASKTVDASAASILPRLAPLPESSAWRSDTTTLKSGLDALAARDLELARAVRNSLPAGALDRHILAWAIALGGGDKLSSSEIDETARSLPGWPGLVTLRKNKERAMFRERPDAQTVIAAFQGSPPKTPEGAIMLARAYLAQGDPNKARAVIAPLWRSERLQADIETAILNEFGKLIPIADHRIRMERMLYFDRIDAAGRVAVLAGASELWSAWASVIRNGKDAGTLLDAVPRAQRSAGWLFARIKYLRRAARLSEAAAAMLSAPGDKATLIDPDAWWLERRALSRELVDTGEIRTAYEIVAAHSAESQANAADAEFHAGWYALRGLGDPVTAARHFSRITDFASGPISLSRAYYWLGRAAEAGGPGDAKAYFEKASTYGTAFYGQLAAARMERKAMALAHPRPSARDRQTFAQREPVRAIQRLEEAGYGARAEILYRDLGEQLSSPGELALLAEMAERRGNHFLALRVSKAAAARGIDVGALSYPLGAIPVGTDMSGAGQALAYAVARQESEFNVGAMSSAGALGLLQILPSTAKDVAKRNGLAYSQTRLATDAGYNATLGSVFLAEQLGRFEGSYILTFACYNAGQSRTQQWIDRYGDPRGKDIDTVVDWIERIPFAETRSYVQRVMENYQVYKMRLSGKFDIVTDLVNGR